MSGYGADGIALDACEENMGKNSAIEWTDHTWNPWRGCHKISTGCKNCYMFREQKRYGRDPSIVVKAADGTFYAPLRWKESAFVFTCSWSDFFIEEADPWRADAWDVIRQTPHLTYLVLTKRLENIAGRLPYDWPLANVWLGESIENQITADERIPQLLQIPAAVRFVSAEPLLGPVNLTAQDDWLYCKGHFEAIRWKTCFCGLDWLIVGGESGPNARPMHSDWVRSLRDQCIAAGIPFFFKQWGEWLPSSQYLSTDLEHGYYDIPKRNIIRLDGEDFYKVGKKSAGRLLDGREWNQRP